MLNEEVVCLVVVSRRGRMKLKQEVRVGESGMSNLESGDNDFLLVGVSAVRRGPRNRFIFNFSKFVVRLVFLEVMFCSQE